MSANMNRDIELGPVEPITDSSHTDNNTDTSYGPQNHQNGTRGKDQDHTINSQSGNFTVPECPTRGTSYTCHICDHICPSVSSDPNKPYFPKVGGDSSKSRDTFDSILSGFANPIKGVTSRFHSSKATTEQKSEVDASSEEGRKGHEGKSKERACSPQRSVVQFRRRDVDKLPEGWVS